MPTTEDQFRSLILPFTLKEEGGYSKDRNDPGNWTGGRVGVGTFKGTKYGIAANSHPTLDIINLTVAQAGDIYWKEYFPQWCRDLDPALAMVIFDCNVNCGQGEGKKVLATALKAQGLVEQVKTATAANLSYHRSLKTWPRYGAVWGARINRCQAQAIKIMQGSPSGYPVPQPESVTPSAPKPKALGASATQAVEPIESPRMPIEAPKPTPLPTEPKKTDSPVAPPQGFWKRLLNSLRSNQLRVSN
jgi:lysozyme family protein